LLAGHVAAEPMVYIETVNGVERRALVFPGKDALAVPSPVVFAFHGFSSSATVMAESNLHGAWPEATVVYPLGFPTFSQRYLRDVPAWQSAPGEDNDRDVAFIDLLLADLRNTLKVDDRRVYAAGISNGALFCYVLLTLRPKTFAAFAPVAGAADFVRRATVPKPVLIFQGKYDTTVTPEAAKKTRDALRALNGCGSKETAWAPGFVSYQPCASGQPVVWHLFAGGHEWPDDATRTIVKFFKQFTLPE